MGLEPERMHAWETRAREQLGVTTDPLAAGYILTNGEFLDCLTRTTERVEFTGAVAAVAGGHSEYRRQTVQSLVDAGMPSWIVKQKHVIARGFALATGAIRMCCFRRYGHLEMSCELLHSPSRRQIRAIWDIPDLETIRCDLVEPGWKCIQYWHEEGRPAVETFLERLPQYADATLATHAAAENEEQERRRADRRRLSALRSPI